MYLSFVVVDFASPKMGTFVDRYLVWLGYFPTLLRNHDFMKNKTKQKKVFQTKHQAEISLSDSAGH